MIIYIITAPFVLFLSFCKEKYKISLKSRFFLYKNLRQHDGDVYFHACSFGEIKSIAPLVANFDSVKISTITQTGFNEALRYTKKVNYLPFEIFIPFWMSSCKVLVIFEAELWLMLVFMAKLKGAKIILINARISDRSFKRYEKFSWFYKYIFSFIDEIFSQSQKDKERLLKIGAKNIIAYKNIKASLENKIIHYTKPYGRVIIFASTHFKEEELLLKNLQLEENDRLIIAPRHPERFLEVEKLLIEFCNFHSFNMQKFSDLKIKSNDLDKSFYSKVLLLDVLGELVNFYAISDIVFLCGSFVKNIGGHNPIEAARFKNIIISGRYYFNQESLYNEVDNIYICNEVKDINKFLKQKLNLAKLKQQNNLDEIIYSIKKGLNARESL